jgi:hypothetical protein
VFSSSDLAKSKASGRIFSHISNEYQLPPERFLHVGDHEHSDVAAPNRKGFKSFHLSDARLNRYESTLADGVWGTSGLSAAMAGASKFARLSLAAVPSCADRQALVDVAAGVASPILVGYVLWILRRAQARGLTRLYFLSRDGQVLFEIARILTARLGISIEPRYLYVSRLSTNLAGTFEANDEELSWVLRDALNATVEQSLRLLDIEWEQVADLMRDCGFASPDEILTAQRTVGFGSALQTAGLRRIILEKARCRRQLVSAYLAQEGVLERPVGLVDFGGVGSQMRALHSVVRAAGGPGPISYLVGLDDPRDAGLPLPATTPAWLTDAECYLYDHRREKGIKRFRGFGTCVQMFCAADHTTVVGYREEEGVVTPELSGVPQAADSQWDLQSFREAISLFTKHLVLDADVVDPYADVRNSACEVIKIFWAKPTKAEARTWGSFPFEGAQVSSSTTNTLARSYSGSYIVRGMLNGTFPNLGWQHWYEGSLKLSPVLLRVVLQCAEDVFRRWDTASEPRWNRFARVIRRALGRRVNEKS